jgi:hypothetical protein
MTEEPNRATIEDLEKAKADSARWEDAWANDSSNNPDKHHSQRQEARERVRLLTRQLKAQGDLPVSEAEAVSFELERLHPRARHGDTAEHQGRRFRRHCTPARMSRTGNPMSWDCVWVTA